uniref:BZIP domain-containing protein n=1 Tax=Erythrolobus australicus TaxID=1077150 RepID=A0A7S1TN20_9RHOD
MEDMMEAYQTGFYPFDVDDVLPMEEIVALCRATASAKSEGRIDIQLQLPGAPCVADAAEVQKADMRGGEEATLTGGEAANCDEAKSELVRDDIQQRKKIAERVRVERKARTEERKKRNKNAMYTASRRSTHARMRAEADGFL